MAWLRRLHAWAGLALCLFLAVVAFTGAALVFKDDIRRVIDSARANPPSPGTAAVVMRAAEAGFGRDRVQTVIFASKAVPRHEASLRGGGVAVLDDRGQILARRRANERPLDAVFDIHHHLFMGEAGIAVTGWIGVAAFLMTVSGLILWWPARRSFSPRPFPGRDSRGGWLAAHRDLAVMTAPLIVISLLTGIPNALQPISRPILGAPPPAPPKANTSGPVDWDAVLASAHARFPDAAIRMATEPAQPGAPAAVRVRQPQEWHVNGRTIAWLEPATGEVIAVYDDKAQPRGGKLYNALWPIHAAKVGGPVWKLLIMASGLSLGLLALYGGESYRRRLMSPGKRT